MCCVKLLVCQIDGCNSGEQFHKFVGQSYFSSAAEKNLKVLREVLEALPSAHLTFVGDGPHRPDLEAHFAGCRVTFTVTSFS